MLIAHFSEDNREQLLESHLKDVALMASEFAKEFDTSGNASIWANICGLLHDLGKVQDAMQHRLYSHGDGPKVEHSSGGTGFLLDEASKYPFVCLLTYCISGHHGGLPNGGRTQDLDGEAATLVTKYNREKERGNYYNDFVDCIKLPEWRSVPNPSINPIHRGFSIAFFLRMIFSCLVDADFLDTERFMSNGAIKRPASCTLKILDNLLTNYIAKKFANLDGDINNKRLEIRLDCESSADQPSGLFSLTVPTGGGKTISSMVFAMRHALKNGQKRVIYVIPYTSIIDQTVEIFSEIFGPENVLAHHSRVEYNDENEDMNSKRLASENWDAPIVVTTNVQFFESFFASRTSKCRKLHNVANSVLIFDEAQVLPLKLLKPSINTITELVTNYRCSAVLCTATQPSFGRFFPECVTIKEIVRDAVGLYNFFKRVNFERIGVQSDIDLVNIISMNKQVLCVVNTKVQAQNLFKLIKYEGTYHLSTNMHAKHRNIVINEIRECLKQGLPCRVISTSLIEAGVDLDFPLAMRQLNGLDSIIQVAGRCNREGKHSPEESKVLIFHSEDKYSSKMRDEIKLPGEVAEEVMNKVADLASIESITLYFDALFDLKANSLDQFNIMNRLTKPEVVTMMNKDRTALQSYPFKDIADSFKIIDENTVSVIIPNQEIRQELADLHGGYRNIKMLRKVSLYTVEVRSYQVKNLLVRGILESLDKEIFILNDESAYDEDCGFSVPGEGQAVFV